MKNILKRFLHKEDGAVNIGGVMMLGISMVFLAVGFIFLPISTTATTSLLNYTYSANASVDADTYTGFVSVVGITPLLILIGFLAAAVISGMLGIRVMKGAGTSRADPGGLLLVGLSIVFIAIGLIIEPVMLDGVSSIVSGGISSSFTGYHSVILITPLLVHLGFLASAVLSGFFGIKRLGSKSEA
jgi:hypothetical protein